MQPVHVESDQVEVDGCRFAAVEALPVPIDEEEYDASARRLLLPPASCLSS